MTLGNNIIQKSQFKIGAKTFQLNCIESINFDNLLQELGIDISIARDKIGFIDQYKKKIYVRSDVSEQLQRETLIHEILHALLEDSGISSLNGQKLINIEEIIVSILSPRISAFIQENDLIT